MLSLDYYIFPMKNVLRELSKSSSQVVKGIAGTCVCINIAGLNVMTFILRVGLQEVCVCVVSGQ